MAKRQIAFRLDEKLIGRIDYYTAYLQRELCYLGRRITRADAVRVLLNKALDDALTNEPAYECEKNGADVKDGG